MNDTTTAATPPAPPVEAPMSVEPPVAAAPLFDDSLMESLGDLAAAELEAVADAAGETSRQAPAIEAASEPIAEAVEEPVHVKAADIVKPIQVAVEAPAPKPAVVQNVAPSDARRPVLKPAAAPAPARRSAAPPKGWADRIVGVAAVLLVIAGIGLGAGAYWMKVHGEAPQAAQSAAAPAAPAPAAAPAVPARAPEPAPVAEVVAKAHVEPPAVERAVVPPAPAPVVPVKARPAAAPKAPASRQVTAPPRQVAAAIPARVEPPVREPEPPPPAPAVVPPPPPAPFASVPSVEPLRPYFEPRDVNEAPQIASRVEPRLPEEFRGRELSDVVVVRLLVSQTGRPSSVSLLRRSKAGPALDDAVLASVKQWTFSPAKKKGEAVSCWFNVGVPVGKAN